MILPFLIAWPASRINRHQDHVIRYLREENRILKAKLKGKRIKLTDTERRRLTVLAHPQRLVSAPSSDALHAACLPTPPTPPMAARGQAARENRV